MLGARGISFGHRPHERHLDVVRDAGFDLVRLPVEWPAAVDAAFMAGVEAMVAAALRRDLAVVLDVHHYDGTDARLLELWAWIAPHFAGADDRLAFELLNEPHGARSGERWNELLARALAVVRETNPERTVIAGPARRNTISGLETLALPADEHLVVTVHYYLPFAFTHQGADWIDGAADWLGETWGEEADRARVRVDLEGAAAWARERGHALFVGEFGALDTADPRDRVEWTELVRTEAERLGLPWAYWDFSTGFGAYDVAAGAWRAPLLDALLPRARTLAEHAPQNVMTEAGEIARFHDRCSDLMRELLGALAAAPDRPRAFPVIEDAMGWPRRRIASVLGGVSHLRHTEFGGLRPYRFLDDKQSASGRWELWMDAGQARAVRAARCG
jgi:endoglucanase